MQPLHFTGGEEFDKLKNNILAHEGEGQLEVLRVGRPLVYYMGQEEHPDDYQILIDRFIKSLNFPKMMVCYWSVMEVLVLAILHMVIYSLS